MASPALRRSFVLGLGCVASLAIASNAFAASRDEDARAEDASADSSKVSSSEESESDESEDVATTDKAKKTVAAEDKSFSHKGQFSLRLALGASYRVVMRYDNSPPCSSSLSENGELKTMCAFGSPASLDTAIGYSPTAGIEPFLWGRFGLSAEQDTRTAPLVIIGAGVRLYTMSDSAFKFFVEPALGLEFDKGIAPGDNRSWEYRQDVIVRLTLGPQLDFSRNVGVYVAGGLTVGALRYLHVWMDLHAGLQVRFP